MSCLIDQFDWNGIQVVTLPYIPCRDRSPDPSDLKVSCIASARTRTKVIEHSARARKRILNRTFTRRSFLWRAALSGTDNTNDVRILRVNRRLYLRLKTLRVQGVRYSSFII